jgi:NADH dehydrogenase
MDEEHSEEIVSARRVSYDLLVLAVGSNINDFGTPGVIENAMALDSTAQADRFHRRLVNAFLRAHAQTVPLRRGQLDVAIVGAGATGVELAAELHNATRELVSFSLDNIDPDKHIRLHLIEASPRILPALPERISIAARRMLDKLNVEVHCDARVAEEAAAAERERVQTAMAEILAMCPVSRACGRGGRRGGSSVAAARVCVMWQGRAEACHADRHRD